MSLPVFKNRTIWQNLPQDWQPIRLKYISRFAYGDSLPSDQREEGNIPVFGSNGIVGYHNLANTLAPTIVIGRKGSFGKVAYSEQPGFAIDTTYFIDYRYTKEHLRWLYYALQTLGLDDFSQDTGVPGLAREKAYEFYLNVPPYNLQKAIASFLDRKTAAIATLIAKKQRLIQLLEEKRIALINQAVTKGLNTNVPMKDSGIPWIGKIPEHWKAVLIKRVASVFVPQRNKPELNEEIGYPWITLEEVGQRFVENSNRGFRVSDDAAREAGSKALQAGAVITGCVGTFGTASITKSYVIINQQIQAYIPKKIESDFLRYCILNSSIYFKSIATATTIAYVNKEGFEELPIPLPPKQEQTLISQWLNKNIQQIERLKINIELQIDRLQEYRQSLITEAVTGKIDVREEVTA